jgi:hypothetical protein
MSLPWVGDSDLLWDTLILGGEVWPGLPTVESTSSRSVDAQKKKGDDGASLVDQGYEPAKVKITIRVWLREQWEELQRLLATIHPRKKGGIRTPVDIMHPETQLKGVRQIYFTTIGTATPGRGAEHGSMTITLDAIEWFPAPKPAKPIPKASKADKTGGGIPPANKVLPPGAQGSAGEFV